MGWLDNIPDGFVSFCFVVITGFSTKISFTLSIKIIVALRRNQLTIVRYWYANDSSFTFGRTCDLSKDGCFRCSWLTQQPRLWAFTEHCLPPWVILLVPAPFADGCTTQEYMHTDRYGNCPYHHISVTYELYVSLLYLSVLCLMSSRLLGKLSKMFYSAAVVGCGIQTHDLFILEVKV